MKSNKDKDQIHTYDKILNVEVNDMIEWQRKWRSSQISPEKFKRKIGGYTTAKDGIIQRHHDKNPNKNLILQQMGLRPKRGDARLRSMDLTHTLGKKKLMINGN